MPRNGHFLYAHSHSIAHAIEFHAALIARGSRKEGRRGAPLFYSHSIVPGGFDVTSSTTRLTSGTWLVILFEIRASTS